jgi:non-specific serine/threonine protein kinase
MPRCALKHWPGSQVASTNPRLAVVLMGAAEILGHAVGSSAIAFPHLTVCHEECERRAREALGAKEFDAAREGGCTLRFDDAVAYALDNKPGPNCSGKRQDIDRDVDADIHGVDAAAG